MPMSGLVVLDLTQAYLGPYATFLMAKAGADVIKIEPPGGEITRLRGAVNPGATLPFSILNTNKRSVVLNLKSAEGTAAFLAFAEKADVVVENFAPGVMDRLGVGWHELRKVNRKLIYASGTGFGLTGENINRQAMDVCIQAYSGIMSITGEAEGPPLKAGPAIADFHSGVHLYAATVTALLHRARTGEGSLVEIAMQEAMVPALASSLGLLHQTGMPPRPTGNRHNGLALCPYSVYPASNGWVAIASVTEAHWRSLAKVMGQPELAQDPAFATVAARCHRMEEVDAIVAQWTSARTKDEVVRLLTLNRVPAAPVRDLEEVMSDADMHARGMLETIEDPVLGSITVPSSPLRIHGVSRPTTTRRPEIGEHTDAVWEQLLGRKAPA